MEELPEKNTPPFLPEGQEPSAEDASPPVADQQPPQEPAPGSESTPPAAEVRAEEFPAKDASPEEAPAAAAEDSRSPSAADRVEGALGEAPAQTGGPAPEAPAEAARQNLDEVQLTSSGAVMVPGEEAPRSEEPRPRKGPAREEKPAGPHIAELRPGQVVEGTVTRIEKYGAFVNLGLAERRDGLIHISELAPYRVRRVEDVVQVGAPIRARVVSVDLGRGRIALSLNDVDEGTAKEATAGPSEPALTSMAMAFQQAQGRQRDSQRSAAGASGRVGDKKRREQEDLMRRLRGENG